MRNNTHLVVVVVGSVGVVYYMVLPEQLAVVEMMGTWVG